MPPHRRGSRPTGQRPPGESFKKVFEIAVDGAITAPYMAVHRRGGRVNRNASFASHRSVIPVPRIKTGKVRRRLFDIVGLDEGTCGRRPRSPAASRRWMIGQTKPFYMSRYISTVICDVQERLLESRSSRLRVFPRGVRIGHKLESLILAQNERWRHA